MHYRIYRSDTEEGPFVEVGQTDGLLYGGVEIRSCATRGW